MENTQTSSHGHTGRSGSNCFEVTCNTLHRGGHDQHFTYRSIHTFTNTCTGLKDLLRELQQVIEWKHLGQLLGLSESDLEAIYEENETTEDCRREMLLLWMERDPDCSWKKIVDALIEMRAETLAAQIASKYGNQ